MTETTELDRAHAAMEAAPEDDAARLAFYGRLADGELFLLLEREPEGDAIAPRLFDVEGTGYALAFDRPDRLTDFTGAPAPYAALSGRTLARMLAGNGLGLGLNLETAPSAMLLPPDAIGWLAATLGDGPREAEARIAEIAPPRALPEALLPALDRRLAGAGGLARSAYLVATTYDDGSRGHLLAVIDAAPGAEPAIATAVADALTFSGLEAGALDVAFFPASSPHAAAFARHGLRFDLPDPPAPAARGAPGSDPDRPPKLR
ncbi:hypothetical protein OG2516_13329 [Oceanicola granulosus HTCC2516]|uniref:SseB protein N-terminal domain-containing protein n=1 Tax=Oceanicola granulosus (strain ATCC BAA-861 / DSM 15982 / KCTC 12143 / HTCC2516) TaxID=314256 RepID=Q2CH02_OCEGH|nr:SseB family protein [Oceanicola granulosus]EAR52009.1 hypothetical protein OG2516_13329 [Oceanicola granulosus HTCC2516]